MDLGNSSNWNTVYSSNRVGSIISSDIYGRVVYHMLSDVETTLATPIGIINLTSNYVHPRTKQKYYGIGCYLDAFLTLAGNETKIYSRRCPIHTATLLELPNLGIYPYKLKLSFPYWIQQIFVEVKQFVDQSGRYLDQDESVLYTAVEIVEQQQQALEELIRQTTSS